MSPALLGGSLTYAQFAQAMRLFVAWWQETWPEGPAWTLGAARLPVTGQVIEYAVLQRVVCSTPAAAAAALQQPHEAAAAAATGQVSSQQHADDGGVASGHEDASAASADAVDDEAAVGSSSAVVACVQRHVHEYSVCYHDTYRVPVLYVRGMQPDGRLLSLQELLQDLPALRQQQHEVAAQQQPDWAFMAPLEHPLLRVPCFMLHPCQTAERMALLMAHRAATDGGGAEMDERRLLCYVQAWSSMVLALLLDGAVCMAGAW